MKKTMLCFMGFIMLGAGSNLAFAQQANTGGGTTGGACTITAGPNSGKSGTYDGTGWCCTKPASGQTEGSCTECARQDGSNSCKDAATKPITTSFGISGTWVVTTATGQPAKTGIISVKNNTFSVNLSSASRTPASGILIDKSTIRITYPDKKVSVFGTITSASRIDWSDGSYWTKKKS